MKPVDPDETLLEMVLLTVGLGAERADRGVYDPIKVDALLGAFADLDAHLCDGGVPPKSWMSGMGAG